MHVEPNSSKSSPWLPGSYKQWKQEHFEIDDEPNARTGQMLRETSLGLNAKSVFNKREIKICYGIDAPPSSSQAPHG